MEARGVVERKRSPKSGAQHEEHLPNAAPRRAALDQVQVVPQWPPRSQGQTQAGRRHSHEGGDGSKTWWQKTREDLSQEDLCVHARLSQETALKRVFTNVLKGASAKATVWKQRPHVQTSVIGRRSFRRNRQHPRSVTKSQNRWKSEMEEQKKNPEGPTVLGATTRQEQWKEECETNNTSSDAKMQGPSPWTHRFQKKSSPVREIRGPCLQLSPAVSQCLPSCGGWVLVGVAALLGTQTCMFLKHLLWATISLGTQNCPFLNSFFSRRPSSTRAKVVQRLGAFLGKFLVVKRVKFAKT